MIFVGGGFIGGCGGGIDKGGCVSFGIGKGG